MCLLKIAEPVCEHIFEQSKHQIVIVMASELTVLSYLNVFSVIPWGKHQFLPSNGFWENRKSLFIAEPRSILTVAMNNESRKNTIEYYL